MLEGGKERAAEDFCCPSRRKRQVLEKSCGGRSSRGLFTLERLFRTEKIKQHEC